MTTDALLARVETHLGQRDAEGLWQDLLDLEPCTLDSGNEAYVRWRALRYPVVQFLYEALPFERFLQIPLSNTVLAGYQVIRALDAHATLDHALELVEHFDELPPEDSLLFARLADEPGEELTRRLTAWADRHFASCKNWFAADATRPLALLSRRGAWDQLESYLETPPWKNLPGPTRSLLHCFSQRADVQERAWENRALPIEVRLTALTLLEPEPVPRALRELLESADCQAREVLLLWLDGRRWPDGPALTELAGQLRQANLRGWSVLHRGFLDGLLRRNAPSWPRPAGSGLLGRLALSCVALFERVRVPVLGCGFCALVATAGFFAYQALLDRLLGPERLHGLSMLALAGWLLAMGWSARPDFAASLEGLSERLVKAVLLLLATAAVLLVPWADRL